MGVYPSPSAVGDVESAGLPFESLDQTIRSKNVDDDVAEARKPLELVHAYGVQVGPGDVFTGGNQRHKFADERIEWRFGFGGQWRVASHNGMVPPTPGWTVYAFWCEQQATFRENPSSNCRHARWSAISATDPGALVA